MQIRPVCSDITAVYLVKGAFDSGYARSPARGSELDEQERDYPLKTLGPWEQSYLVSNG